MQEILPFINFMKILLFNRKGHKVFRKARKEDCCMKLRFLRCLFALFAVYSSLRSLRLISLQRNKITDQNVFPAPMATYLYN